MAELIAITGASGFIGRQLVHRLLADGCGVRLLQRTVQHELLPGVEQCVTGDLNSDADFKRALSGATAVVHLAARVHQMGDDQENALAQYERVNTLATLNLARSAAESNVRRFVFLSTVKVNGEFTDQKPFSESDPPCPSGAYAISKWKAEEGLRQISRESGLEVVILRCPLVYGPGVRGNFLRLMDLVSRMPVLPLGNLRNRRSMVGLSNLTDLIAGCIVHEKAAGETFIVSDGRDLSVTELIGLMAAGLQRRCWLLPVPKRMLEMLAALGGKQEVIRRLTDSLQVDIGKARRVLGWKPPTPVESELARTVEWYKRTMPFERERDHGRSA